MKKRLLVSTFVVITVMMAAFGTVASLQALPIGTVGFDDNYYSDPNFTNWVGEHYQQCNGGSTWYGTRGEYVIAETFDCQDLSSPGVCGYYHCSGYPWDRDECSYLGMCY